MAGLRTLLFSASALCLVSGLAIGQPSASADFDTVASKLDKGGSFYLISDTRGTIDKVAKMIDNFSAGSGNGQALAIGTYLRVGGKALGFSSVEMIGASEVPFGDGGVRQKSYLMMPKPEGLFTLLGKPAAAMEISKYIPADAAIGGVKDVKYAEIIPLARSTASSMLGAVGTGMVDKALEQGKMEGVDGEAMLRSLSGETMLWMRLDDGSKVTLGEGSAAITMARPGFALALKTNSPVIFETLKKMSEKKPGKITLTNDSAGEILTAIVDKNPMGWSPVFAQREGMMFIASSPEDFKLAEDSAASGGLFASERFKKVTEGMPAAVSAVGFVGPQVLAAAKDVLGQVQSHSQSDRMSSSIPNFSGLLEEVLPGKNGLATWATWDDTGLLMVTQGDKVNRNFAQSGGLFVAPIMAAVAVPNFLEAGLRSKVSRVRSDQRSMATGLEAYFVDNNTYPAFTTVEGKYVASPGLARQQIPGAQMRGGAKDASNLTTPISYLARYPEDSFAGPEDTFAYYSVKTNTSSGWVLWSPGPDKKYDLNWELYNPDETQPSPELLNFAYDPTNGTLSPGDIFRVKQ